MAIEGRYSAGATEHQEPPFALSVEEFASVPEYLEPPFALFDPTLQWLHLLTPNNAKNGTSSCPPMRAPLRMSPGLRSLSFKLSGR